MGAALLLLAAVALPPAATAAALRGDAAIPAGLVAGLWLLKGLLAWHGVAMAIVARRQHATGLAATPAFGRSGWGILALLIGATVLRWPGLDRGLWYDEIQTLLDYVRQPLGILVTTFDSSNQHLLFSICAHLARALLGDSATALRLPAMLFGVLSIWAAVSFGRRWLPPRQAWWSAVILAVSYHHIWFSQNARGYTGLLLGTLVASTLFADLLRESPRPGRIWGYAAAMGLTIVTHVTGAVVLAAHGLCWLASWRRNAPRTREAGFTAMLLAASFAAAWYAPVLPQLFHAVGESGTAVSGVEWQRPGWFVAEALRGLMRGIPAGPVVVPVALLIVCSGLWSAWRRDRIIAAMMLLPMVLLAAPLLASGHNLWPRFFFFAAGFVVQWAVHGGFVVLDRLVPRHAQRIGDAGLGLITLASLALVPRAWLPKQDYPAAAAWIAEHAAPGDAIVGTEMMGLPMNRWLGHDWPIVSDVASLRAIESGAPRTWVLYTFPIRLEATAPGLRAHLDSAYTVAHVVPASIGGGEVVIVAMPPAP